MQLITSYPLRMPLALSCWTGSHDTWISKAVSAVALMFDGPTVGSVWSRVDPGHLAERTFSPAVESFDLHLEGAVRRQTVVVVNISGRLHGTDRKNVFNIVVVRSAADSEEDLQAAEELTTTSRGLTPSTRRYGPAESSRSSRTPLKAQVKRYINRKCFCSTLWPRISKQQAGGQKVSKRKSSVLSMNNRRYLLLLVSNSVPRLQNRLGLGAARGRHSIITCPPLAAGISLLTGFNRKSGA
ncbi:hypothetical protein EYF80_001454 [Liparis tanakae]|uniref:Uncharacterized protein n=1 Tax=Liparis tanakae TaxID=230148 RepID=A0A4Z2JF33_9TELE|nr:hypothetical protein EYF80_001454 [Liparis tanakae]